MKKQLLIPFRGPKLEALWERLPVACRQGLIALYAQLIEKMLRAKATAAVKEPTHGAVLIWLPGECIDRASSS
ncbi:MAG: hypothetical protein AB1486_32315 [Planctomycetota bacterium]